MMKEHVRLRIAGGLGASFPFAAGTQRIRSKHRTLSRWFMRKFSRPNRELASQLASYNSNATR